MAARSCRVHNTAPERVFKNMFGDDRRGEMVLRAATAPAEDRNASSAGASRKPSQRGGAFCQGLRQALQGLVDLVGLALETLEARGLRAAAQTRDAGLELIEFRRRLVVNPDGQNQFFELSQKITSPARALYSDKDRPTVFTRQQHNGYPFGDC